jgi:hypothetical protein
MPIQDMMVTAQAELERLKKQHAEREAQAHAERVAAAVAASVSSRPAADATGAPTGGQQASAQDEEPPKMTEELLRSLKVSLLL